MSPRSLPTTRSPRRRARAACAAALAAASAFGAAQPAAAAPAAPAKTAAARALFREGRELMKAGQFEQACPKLEESLRLDPGMGTRFNLAHCWERQGRTASAWAMFLDVAAEARVSGQSKRQSAAERRAAALESKLVRLEIEVEAGGDATPDVLQDGLALGPAAWGTATPVDPGMHVIEAKSAGHAPWREVVEVPAGGGTVVVRVPALEALPAQALRAGDTPPRGGARPEAAPVGPQSPELDHEGGGGRATGVVMAAVGAATALVGTGFLVKSRLDDSEARGLCTETNALGQAAQCASEDERRDHAAAVESAEDNQRLAFILGAAGGAVLATGAVLYFWDSISGSGDRASFGVNPTASANGAGVSLWGRF